MALKIKTHFRTAEVMRGEWLQDNRANDTAVGSCLLDLSLQMETMIDNFEQGLLSQSAFVSNSYKIAGYLASVSKLF